MKTDNGQDGIRTIHKLLFSIDKESLNPHDNEYVIENNKFFVVNVTSFMTLVRFEVDSFHEYDLREPVSKIMFPSQQYQEQQQYQQQQQHQQQRSNVVPPNYTNIANMKPRATKSVNIDLGGVRR